jgi:predicted O-linked N-acetylglucosamine transferase (SPINDLY family)|tara:strand:+ start:5683 stop:8145 length:2463 start_codon:yes stop_codon:yes gene_type:complete
MYVVKSANVPQSFQLALQLHRNGQLQEAEHIYDQILVADPENADANHLLGVLEHQVGRDDRAIRLIRRAIHCNPHVDAFHNNLGEAYRSLNHLNEAVASYQRAISINPNYAGALCNLGNVLLSLAHPDRAIAYFNRAIAIEPDYAEAYCNLGDALTDLHQLTAAVTYYERAIEIRPDYTEAYNNLGNACRDLSHIDEAIEAYKRALTIQPERAEIHNNLGRALYDSGCSEYALACYRKAISIDPGHAQAFNNLGSALRNLGELEQAVTSFKEAISINPNYAQAYSNLGAALHGSGESEEALTCIRKALSIQPDCAEAHYNLGSVLYDLGSVDESVASYEKAISLKPDYTEAHINLGSVLQEKGQLTEAVAICRKAVSIDPNNVQASSNLLFVVNYNPSLSAEDIFAEYRRWNDRHAAPLKDTWIRHEIVPPSGRRIKVGYVSPDFRNHSARFFIEPLLANHNHLEVEIFCYGEVKREDSFTERCKELSDHWLNTVGMSDAALASRIRADGIDVLMDLAGHSVGNRLLVFARRPAPVQITWLGYGYTTGMDAMDYFLADAHFVPHGFDHLFSETVHRIPRLPFAYQPPDDMPATGALPAQQRDHVTFGCFSRLLRINDKVMASWSRILAEVKGSRLMLDSKPFVNAERRQQFMHRLSVHGIAPDRADLIYSTPQTALWQAYNRIDIALDPFPHNAGTTTFEALWMGVPVVALKDRPPLGRFGSTLLNSIGMQDWLAEDIDSYIRIAVEKSRDLQRLATLRSNLRQAIANSPICDAKGLSLAFEQAYHQMLRKESSGVDHERVQDQVNAPNKGSGNCRQENL